MKLIIFGLIGAVVVIGTVVYIVGFKSNPQQAIDEETLMPQAESTLTVIDNNVKAKLPADLDFKDVAAELKIKEGSKVKTSSTGRAVVESPDSTSTVVDKNSEITIAQQSDPNKTRIRLESGNLWSRVKKLFGKGEYYQVETNNAVATVRGTVFGVFYISGQTIIMVTEGTVWAISIDPKTKEPIGEEVIIGQGQKATIKDGQIPLVEAITVSDKKSDWYIYNQPENNLTPTLAPSIKPTPKLTVTPKQTPVSSRSPTPMPQLTGTPIPQPTPTPTPLPPELYSVVPKSVNVAKGSADFFINGRKLKNVVQVLLNKIPISFYSIDEQTIGGTATRQLQPGVYDVTVKLSTGEDLTLPAAFTVTYE